MLSSSPRTRGVRSGVSPRMAREAMWAARSALRSSSGTIRRTPSRNCRSLAGGACWLSWRRARSSMSRWVASMLTSRAIRRRAPSRSPPSRASVAPASVWVTRAKSPRTRRSMVSSSRRKLWSAAPVTAREGYASPGAAPARPATQSAMAEVQTVRGPVDTAALGRTYMHEHVFVLTADVQQNWPQEWGSEDDRVADAVAKLTALAEQGVRTIADPTVIGLGRYIPRIQRIAEQVPQLNIIVATGCYTYKDVPFYFHYRGPALSAVVGTDVPDPMVDLFVGDITEGIAGTGVRAAFL